LTISPQIHEKFLEEIKSEAGQDIYRHVKKLEVRFWENLALETGIDRICRVLGENSQACLKVIEYYDVAVTPPPLLSTVPPSPSLVVDWLLDFYIY